MNILHFHETYHHDLSFLVHKKTTGIFGAPVSRGQLSSLKNARSACKVISIVH